MQNRHDAAVLEYVRRIFAGPGAERTSDRELLRLYAGQGDQAAFGILVKRHGPMVLSLCRRLVKHRHDAEDVCQATFCVLAAKAGRQTWQPSVASWLHRVAYHLALKANSAVHRRKALDAAAPKRMAGDDPLDAITARELRTILDKELVALPEKYRAPLVLCYLEGATRDQAARRLGWPLSTLKSRVERGCGILRSRLQSRGLALSGALSAVALIDSPVQAAMPGAFWRGVTSGAHAFAAGNAGLAAAISVQSCTLAETALKSMTLVKLKIAAAVLTVISCLTAGSAAVAIRLVAAGDERPTSQTPPFKPATVENRLASVQPPKLDIHGDPLPEGAISRLGTTRLRHAGAVHWLQFTPDGKTLISQGGDGVGIWKADTGQKLHLIADDFGDNKQMPFDSTSLSQNGELLAVTGKTAVHLYEVATGKRVKSIDTGSVRFTRFSPDSKTLAVQSQTQPWPITVWDVASGKQLYSVAGDGPLYACLAFTPDGKALVAAGNSFASKPAKTDYKMSFWDVATGKKLRQIPLGTINARKLAFSPDGMLMAMATVGDEAGRPENCIRIFDLATAKEIRQLVAANFNSKLAFSHALAFSPDGKMLYHGGFGGKLVVWDAATWQELGRLGMNVGPPSALAVSQDGLTLAVSFLGAARMLEADSGRDKLAVGHSSYILYTAVSGDGKRILTGDTHSIIGWDSETGRELYRHNMDRAMGLYGQLVNNGQAFLTRDVVFPDEPQALRLHALQTGKEIRRWEWDSKESDKPWPAAIAPDGKTLAMLAQKSSVVLMLEMETGKELRTIDLGEPASGVSFSSNGRWLIVHGSASRIRIWDVKDGRLVRTFQGTLASGTPQGLIAINGPIPPRTLISPDCTLLAVYQMQSKFIAFQDLSTGKVIRRIDDLPSTVSTAAFSPDGRCLAWGDKSVHLVEVATGQEREVFNMHRSKVDSLAFSADGRTLVSGSSDTSALVWDLTGQRAGNSKLAKNLNKVALDASWADLAGEDAARAGQAIKRLAAAPADAVAYLKTKLAPAPIADEQHVARLVADLDNKVFAVRQAAASELEKIGEQAAGALEKATTGKSSLEFVRRAQEILAKQAAAWQTPGPENLRIVRALEVLERAGTPAARAEFQRLARGAPGARITAEAAAALERMSYSVHTGKNDGHPGP